MSPLFPEFVAGEVIALASSADVGFEVEAWSGTNNDASTFSSNQLAMPAAASLVSVTYGLENDRFLTNDSLTGVQTIDAENSITAGPSLDIAIGADITFRALTMVELRDGFTVLDGAAFEVVLETPPDPCP